MGDVTIVSVPLVLQKLVHPVTAVEVLCREQGFLFLTSREKTVFWDVHTVLSG